MFSPLRLEAVTLAFLFIVTESILSPCCPGPHFLLGQIAWAPVEETINGTIVYDGSYSGGGEADLGILKSPIGVTVKNGKAVEFRGGREAEAVKRWLEGLNDPNICLAAHVCYGFNPGARLSGLCTEDKRVWDAPSGGLDIKARRSRRLTCRWDMPQVIRVD